MTERLLRGMLCAQVVMLAVLSGCGRSGSKAPESALVALGNEPFWNVRVTSREILYRDPEHPDGFRFPSVTAVEERDARVYRTRRDIPADDPGPRTLELRIRQGTCSDGMSDRKYPMTAELKMGGQTLTGCAWVQPDAQPPR